MASSGDMVTLAGFAVLAMAIVAAALLLSRRGPERATVEAFEGVADTLQRSLQQVQGEIVRLARQQDDLRQDVTRGREASVLQLADTAREIHAQLGNAHRALAEVKALEQGRAQKLDQAADSLRRLEAVVGEVGGDLVVRDRLGAQLTERNTHCLADFGGTFDKFIEGHNIFSTFTSKRAPTVP